MALISSPHTSEVRISTACHIRVLHSGCNFLSHPGTGRPAEQIVMPLLRPFDGEAGERGRGFCILGVVGQ